MQRRYLLLVNAKPSDLKPKRSQHQLAHSTPLPRLRRGWAHPIHICAGTGTRRRVPTRFARPVPTESGAGVGVRSSYASIRVCGAVRDARFYPGRHSVLHGRMRECSKGRTGRSTQPTPAHCICMGAGLTPPRSAPGLGVPSSGCRYNRCALRLCLYRYRLFEKYRTPADRAATNRRLECRHDSLAVSAWLCTSAHAHRAMQQAEAHSGRWPRVKSSGDLDS